MTKKMTFDEDGLNEAGLSLEAYARQISHEYYGRLAATPDWDKSLAEFARQHLTDDALWQAFPEEARSLALPEPDWL